MAPARRPAPWTRPKPRNREEAAKYARYDRQVERLERANREWNKRHPVRNKYDKWINDVRKFLKIARKIHPLGKVADRAFELGCLIGKAIAYVEQLHYASQAEWVRRGRNFHALFSRGRGGRRPDKPKPVPTHEPKPRESLAQGDYNSTKKGYSTLKDADGKIVEQKPIPNYKGPQKPKPHFTDFNGRPI